MKKRLSAIRSDERGAAAVEFAIILPILLVLVFGVIEFSIAYNRQQGLHAAARQGARAAAIPTTSQQDIYEEIDRALTGVALDGATPDIKVTPASGTPCKNAESVTVQVSVQADIGIPFWDFGEITQSAEGSFKCER